MLTSVTMQSPVQVTAKEVVDQLFETGQPSWGRNDVENIGRIRRNSEAHDADPSKRGVSCTCSLDVAHASAEPVCRART